MRAIAAGFRIEIRGFPLMTQKRVMNGAPGTRRRWLASALQVSPLRVTKDKGVTLRSR
jgi:hypothetical protein